MNRHLPWLAFLMVSCVPFSSAQEKSLPTELPPRALKRFGTSNLRHGDRILCLAYSPNGQILVAGGGADPVRVWNADTGTAKFQVPEPWTFAVAFTPRGSVFFTGGAHKSIRMWEIGSEKEVPNSKMEGHKTTIKALVVSPDGSLLASGSQEGEILLWETATRKIISRLKEHKDEITSLAFSPDNLFMASSSVDGQIIVWDTETNKVVKKMDGGAGVLAVAFADGGNSIVSAGDDNLIRIWNAKTGENIGKLAGHQDMVTRLAVGRDGTTLFSTSRDRTVRRWDLTSRKETLKLERNPGDGDALAVSRDMKRLASAGYNNTIRQNDAETGKELDVRPGSTSALNHLVLSPDGRWMASVSQVGQVYLWDASSGTLARTWATKQGGELLLAFSADGSTLVTAGIGAKLWDPATGTEKATLPTKTPGAISSLAFSSNGKMLALGFRSQQAEIWGWPDAKLLHVVKSAGPVNAVAFSRKSDSLAVGAGSLVVIVSTSDAKPTQQFPTKDGPDAGRPEVSALAFSPDEKSLAVAGSDGVIRIMDSSLGKEKHACVGHTSLAQSLAFSRDGRTLVSGSFDKTARVWEGFSGLMIAKFEGHLGPVHGVAISPDGRTAFSASSDTSAIAWEIPPAGLKDLKNPGNEEEVKTYFGQAWRNLASEDADMANSALWRLTRVDGVIPIIGKSVYLVEPDKITKMLKDLDSTEFKIRDEATKGLLSYGRWMEGRLREELKAAGSIEVYRRMEDLLTKITQDGSLSLKQERLRLYRAMHLLEIAGTPAAVQVFEELARKGPEEAFRDDAKVTLERIRAK